MLEQVIINSLKLIMAAYSIKTVQKIPLSLEEAWSFFSNPANLQLLTPDDMDFRVISKLHGTRMYAGQIIEYKVKPLLGISLYWMTEITHVEEQRFFVDEQRFGPYRFWHHQHHFRQIEGGVEMTDSVHYKNPLWLLGDLANFLFVKKRLIKIFDYRFKKVEELFGKWPS
ncbi:MAG TPA: SRPBCC family protein [Chitinophagaceae bacterium]|nr:SRPBCC family protein [Chitinophagaceae bacterium]